MNRRTFFQSAVAALASIPFVGKAFAGEVGDGWRTMDDCPPLEPTDWGACYSHGPYAGIDIAGPDGSYTEHIYWERDPKFAVNDYAYRQVLEAQELADLLKTLPHA